jgi:hypothetical protein
VVLQVAQQLQVAAFDRGLHLVAGRVDRAGFSAAEAATLGVDEDRPVRGVETDDVH